jgi:glycosyltransferase involved in cell wall biosynthesis
MLWLSIRGNVKSPPPAPNIKQGRCLCPTPFKAFSNTMAPRVLQVISQLALGGAEQLCFTIMRSLHGEFAFHLFAVNGFQNSSVGQMYAEEAKVLGLPVYCGTKLPPKRGGMLTGGLALAKVIKKTKPDLIHLHTEIPEAAFGVAAFLNPSIRSIPLIRTIHNTNVWHGWPTIGRWCEKHMTHAYVACVSRAVVGSFVAGRVNATEPEVLYNGVPDHSPLPPLAKQGDSHRLKILFAARFENQKGAHLLPEIIRSIEPANRYDYDLTIHGCGTHEPLLRFLADNPPTGWQIAVNGPLPGLAEVLPTFDLLLMPSLFEGLPLTAVESLLAGTPVVATSAPGLSEVFSFDYPWLAEPGDAPGFARTTKKAIEDRSQWNDVIARARAFAAERFAVSKMAENYHALYDRAMSRTDT